MSQKYIYWKWSNGGILKQSLRETNKNAKIEEHSEPIQERYEERKRNDRELHSQRLSERGMMIQKSINPFLSTNNYVDDLNIQDQFLRPKDSNIKVDAE
jgi:hypothetical protein